MTTSVTRSSCRFGIVLWKKRRRRPRSQLARPRPIFWSQIGLVLRPTVSDHITGCCRREYRRKSDQNFFRVPGKPQFARPSLRDEAVHDIKRTNAAVCGHFFASENSNDKISQSINYTYWSQVKEHCITAEQTLPDGAHIIVSDMTWLLWSRCT